MVDKETHDDPPDREDVDLDFDSVAYVVWVDNDGDANLRVGRSMQGHPRKVIASLRLIADTFELRQDMEEVSEHDDDPA